MNTEQETDMSEKAEITKCKWNYDQEIADHEADGFPLSVILSKNGKTEKYLRFNVEFCSMYFLGRKFEGGVVCLDSQFKTIRVIDPITVPVSLKPNIPIIELP